MDQFMLSEGTNTWLAPTFDEWNSQITPASGYGEGSIYAFLQKYHPDYRADSSDQYRSFLKENEEQFFRYSRGLPAYEISDTVDSHGNSVGDEEEEEDYSSLFGLGNFGSDVTIDLPGFAYSDFLGLFSNYDFNAAPMTGWESLSGVNFSDPGTGYSAAPWGDTNVFTGLY